MTATFDDDADLEEWADGPAAVPEGAWFSVAGTDDPAVLCPEAFAQGGAADGMEPGALLAALAEGACDPAGLAGVSDNALLGVAGASRRLAARAAAITQRAVAEYARRHHALDVRGASRGGYAEFSPDDLAPELVVNANQAEYAMLRHETDLRRLPACSQALWDGAIGEYPLKIIADQTACLDDAGAREADQILAREAPGLTPGQLRALAARVVLMIDPDAAEERRRDAATRARVVRFREDAGTGALSGRDLPPDAVLRSWQHIDGAAQALKATGIKAGLDKLRAAVYLALTSGTDPLTVLPLLTEYPGEPLTTNDHGGDGEDGRDREGGHEDGDGGRDGDEDEDGGEGGEGGEGGIRPSGPGPSGPAGGGIAPFQAVINLLVPVGTAFGWSTAPGEIPGWGPLDPETTRDMMAAASRHPGPGPAPGRRRRPRTRPAGTPDRRPQTAGSRLPGQPASHARPGSQGHLRSWPVHGQIRGAAHSQAPHPGSQRRLYRSLLQPGRRRRRHRPHRALARRTHLPDQPRAGVQTSSSVQASPGMAARTASTGHLPVGRPSRAHPHHLSHPLPALASGRSGDRGQTCDGRGRVPAVAAAPRRDTAARPGSAPARGTAQGDW